MEGKKGGKLASWHVALTVVVALIAFGKLGARLYQEHVVEPRQREEARNSGMNLVYQMMQARYDYVDSVLERVNKKVSGEDKAKEGSYIESIVRNGEDIVLTSVQMEPMEQEELEHIKADFEKVKKSTLEETLPDACNKEGFFRRFIDDKFNLTMVTKDNNKKEIMSYTIAKSDCERLESEAVAVPEKG
ncbi:hypothetical protein SOASR030_03850 [Leminorella grimontii]|uniref:Uncharacterized protein n=1 Tax=Leminorella grimontii TaxID=82981 RepID=A0AAV5MYC3_9GAMM|nr:hypothetical protein [Leminorella grimontii]KFC96530.1 hypothetical protein GLGR_1706 [Leminorella grimontii ATCC 33999 = DSM 5078]GKX54273.1 hypothetical protein SOASR030_03850 [Leminorella grimontii]VFS59625.1 Uncharacterised protein [Leminorella grimontii]